MPGALVIDNLKAGVTKADRYEGDVNRTYEEMAQHYSTVVLPARPYRPKDKAKVEVSVQVVQRWILARLRNRVFSTDGVGTMLLPAMTNEASHARGGRLLDEGPQCI